MDLILFDSHEVTLGNVVIRVLLSAVLGGLLGWEREKRRQQAGLRTHIVIAVGACLLMLISVYIPQTFSEYRNVDPARLAAQVVSGIGFLGAGAIFRLGGNTHGLTTAATIWAVAAVGLAVGVGMYAPAAVVTIVLLFVLAVLDKVGKRYLNTGTLKTLKITYESSKIETSKILGILENHDIITNNINIVQSKNRQHTTIKLYVYVPKALHVKQLYKELNDLKNVGRISLGQDF
ncbi:MgtC/SapB family protein [Pontibacter burrus]|uniref:MgtC/SapB family protein n=1 Tax=Pontibacter burrus TaxID=2704466 RepID=A0A6B3LNI6_9BACT|nr:MgtC/SapB family protein [Pontibacter burrus]NEM98472.1 MgtC/SapB family protein [Pontibacter burrus]